MTKRDHVPIHAVPPTSDLVGAAKRAAVADAAERFDIDLERSLPAGVLDAAINVVVDEVVLRAAHVSPATDVPASVKNQVLDIMAADRVMAAWAGTNLGEMILAVLEASRG